MGMKRDWLIFLLYNICCLLSGSILAWLSAEVWSLSAVRVLVVFVVSSFCTWMAGASVFRAIGAYRSSDRGKAQVGPVKE